MNRPGPAGFEEIPHTADWALRVWAPDLATLFVTAAKGMNALAGITLAASPRVARSFEAAAADDESLLVAFLSELVYYAEQEYLGFDGFDIRYSTVDDSTSAYRIAVIAQGAKIESLNKAIKAVTYHNLKISRSRLKRDLLDVEIVFDV
jgi:SHS2 domain-containing protein